MRLTQTQWAHYLVQHGGFREVAPSDSAHLGSAACVFLRFGDGSTGWARNPKVGDDVILTLGSVSRFRRAMQANRDVVAAEGALLREKLAAVG